MTFDERAFRALVKEWTAGYCDDFSWHQAMYSRMWATNLPEQDFADGADFPYWQGARVCELGGWDGKLSRSVTGPVEWVIYEVCREAAPPGSVTDRWMWDCDLSRFDTFVATHSLEHMTEAHLDKALAAVKATRALIQVPYDMVGHGGATHILGFTIDDLRSKFRDYGWGVKREKRRASDVVWWFTRPS